MSLSIEATGQAAVTQSAFREWRRFVTILLLMLSPVLIAGAALEALAWRIGETMPMSMISQWQDGGTDRVWRGGDGHSYLTYKIARVTDRKPDILLIGSARANAFRGASFAPNNFFNAGMTGWTFDQYRRFLELVGENGYAPKVLVFDLDYWMFNAGFDHYVGDRFDEKPTPHVASLLRVIGQLRDDPASLWRALPSTDRMHGLYALLAGDGFHTDGSLPGKPATPDPQRLADDSTGVGVPPVELAEHMAPDQITRFDQFVAYAKQKHIALIGIQLPFYAKILDALNTPEAGSWHEFQSPEWRQHMADAGVVFFDFADMPEYRDKPEYFTDSLNATPALVEHVTQLVLADPRVQALLPKPGTAPR
jgi:hypothetical protein